MYFTEKELKRINELLEESRELQRKNGNRTYSMEEVWNNLEITQEERELVERIKAEKIRNGEKIYTEEIYEVLGIEDVLIPSLQKEKLVHIKNVF